MDVKYRNSYLDLIRFNAYHLPRLWVVWLIHGLAAAVFLLSAIGAVREIDVPLGLKIVIAAILTGVFMLGLLTIEAVILLLSYGVRSNQAVLTTHEIRLSEEGVSETTSLGSHFTAWPGILAIRENARYCFIYTSQHSAHVIPKAAFADPAACQAFVDYARSQTQRK